MNVTSPLSIDFMEHMLPIFTHTEAALPLLLLERVSPLFQKYCFAQWKKLAYHMAKDSRRIGNRQIIALNELEKTLPTLMYRMHGDLRQLKDKMRLLFVYITNSSKEKRNLENNYSISFALNDLQQTTRTQLRQFFYYHNLNVVVFDTQILCEAVEGACPEPLTELPIWNYTCTCCVCLKKKLEGFHKWLQSNQAQIEPISCLVLCCVELSFLSPKIEILTNLQNLDLEDNPLTCLPQEIGSLTRLVEINLQSNQLICLPREIRRMKDLTQLNLSDNQLTRLPEEIGQLHGLEKLYLGENQLICMPSQIEGLCNLKDLDLDANKLESLPKEMGKLQNLECIWLNDNPWTTLPWQELESLPRLGQPYKDHIHVLKEKYSSEAKRKKRKI